jgi:hypothetical protein
MPQWCNVEAVALQPVSPLQIHQVSSSAIYSSQHQ